MSKQGASHYKHVDFLSPWLFNREAVDPQNPPQCILGAVDDVLLLLVVQLLQDDVLTQVEHHLRERESEMHRWRR